MQDPTSSSVDGHGGDARGQQVERPDTLEDQRRREIADARHRANEFPVVSLDAQRDGADPDYLLRMYRRIVEAYIREIEPLALGTEACRELWENHTGDGLGVVVAYPPDFSDEFPRSGVGSRSCVARNSMPGDNLEPEVLDVIQSLPDLLDAPSPYTKRWSVVHKARNQPVTKAAKVTQPVVNADVLDACVRGCNRFLAEIGLELQPEDEHHGKT